MRKDSSQGFPLLGRIKSAAVIDYLQFLPSLSRIESETLQRALVKRSHQEGMILAGEQLAEGEQEVIQSYLRRHIEHIPSLGFSFLDVGGLDQKRIRGLASEGTKYLVDRRELRAVLQKVLVAQLGGPPEFLGSRTWWRYSVHVGSWTVYTSVDTGGRVFQLSYHQAVSAERHVDLTEHMSILRWLGIRGQTDWNLLTNADIPEAVELLAELCSHFIAAVAKIQTSLAAD